jgi:cell division septation protein DedD
MAAITAAAWYGVVTLQARSTSRPPEATYAPKERAALTVPPDSASERPIATSGDTVSSRPARPSPSLSTGERPASVPSSARGGPYSVLVGSFRQESEAARLLDELRGLGYQARTARFESEGRGAWHQVLVGPYRDIDQARQDETRVRQLPGYGDARLTTN